MVGEDATDKYAIKWIERRYHNPYIRLLAGSTMNPTRSFANILRLKVPWYRDSRPGVFEDKGRALNDYLASTYPNKG